MTEWKWQTYWILLMYMNEHVNERLLGRSDYWLNPMARESLGETVTLGRLREESAVLLLQQ